jgi:hypothetical protein
MRPYLTLIRLLFSPLFFGIMDIDLNSIPLDEGNGGVVHDVSSFPQDEENVGVGPVEEQLHAGTQYHACYTSYLKKSCLLQFLIF